MANFDRDFGYLMPFLDKVQAAAETAPPAVRTELKALLQGEKARWARIQALLSGEAVREAPPPARREPQAPRAAPAAPPVPVSSGSADVAPRRAPEGAFTVGSLRGR